MDEIIRALAFDGCVSVMAIDGKKMVEAAKSTHSLSRVTTAALGRTAMMTALLGVQLKQEGGRVTAIIKGDGPMGNMVCTGTRADDENGVFVKGYVENPTVELPPTPNGKLDVAGAVGKNGKLTLVRDTLTGEPYSGSIALVSGEIAEDFAMYLLKSEGRPSAVYLGVMVDKDTGDVLSAAGAVIEPLPDCPQELLDSAEAFAARLKDLSWLLSENISLENALLMLLDGAKLDIIEREWSSFMCDCSRERLQRVLFALGTKELAEIAEDKIGASITCQFCNKKYAFTDDDIQGILSAIKTQKTP